MGYRAGIACSAASFLTSFLPAEAVEMDGGPLLLRSDPSAPASVFARLFLRLTWSVEGRQSGAKAQEQDQDQDPDQASRLALKLAYKTNKLAALFAF